MPGLVTPRGFRNRLLRLSEIETMYTHLKSDIASFGIFTVFHKAVNSMRQDEANVISE